MKSSLIIGSLLITTSAWSQTTESPIKFNMGARYRMEDGAYSDLSNRRQFSHLRVRPMLTYDGGQGTKVVLEGQYTKVMGRESLEASSTTANAAVETSGNTAYRGQSDAMWMRQAYIDLKLSEKVNLLLGRQALSYGDQYILGPSDWGVYGRAFDAARVKWAATDKTNVEVFQATLAEATETNSADKGDETLSGFHLTHALNDTVKEINLYAFLQNDDRRSVTGTTTNSNYFGVYGTRFLTEFGNITWKLEYAKNYGPDGSVYVTSGEDKKNDMIDTEVGMKMGDNRLALQMFTAGENWRELFPTTNSALGRTDVLGRRNLTGAAIHHNAKWSDLWSTDVSLYYFTRTSKDTAVYSTNSTTARGTSTVSARDVGTELDLVAKYKLNKDTTLSGSISGFEYGKYFKDSTNVDDKKKPVYGFLMVETKY